MKNEPIKLVLIRHGQTQYNFDKRFCGWTDVNMRPNGEEECRKEGEMLKKHKFEFDIVYTSVLKRSIKTAWIVLETLDQMWVLQKAHWRLNERHYGALQGLHHEEMAKKFSPEQVHLWRR